MSSDLKQLLQLSIALVPQCSAPGSAGVPLTDSNKSIAYEQVVWLHGDDRNLKVKLLRPSQFDAYRMNPKGLNYFELVLRRMDMDHVTIRKNDDATHRKSFEKHNDIAAYIKKIRTNLIKYIPDDATPKTINVQHILKQHLRNAVIETIQDTIPSKAIVNVDVAVFNAMMEAAWLTFSRNEFLLYPKFYASAMTFAGVQSEMLENSSIKINYDGSGTADSYVLNIPTRKQSAREREEKDIKSFKTATELRAMAKRGETFDGGSLRGLSFHARLRQKQEIKKMLEHKDSSIDSVNYIDKQCLAKELMAEINALAQPDPEANSYMSIERIAATVVGDIIKMAKQKVMEYQAWLAGNVPSVSESFIKSTVGFQEPSIIEFVEIFGSFEAWPKINEFNIEVGADRISDYLATWHYDEDWLYDLDMILAQSDACSDFYVYEVKWSIPTQEYPVPQATASIFFTIEVSRVIPRDCYVNVTYKYEGSDYAREPFVHPFYEQWLFNIIETKLKFFQAITF